ncbi:hypothetical protein VU08_04930 [Desulfobulbus sp. F5]|nr:hypothetical protein [Desulfobulbus sp. F5]
MLPKQNWTAVFCWMKQGGKSGPAVRVTDNAVYTVSGSEQPACVAVDGYAGRLVDVVQVVG